MSPLVPSTTVDIFDETISFDPYDTYRSLREAGAAVWQSDDEYWIISRYEDLRAAGRNNEDFISGSGVGHDSSFTQPDTQVLMSDPPTHTRLRGVLMDKLAPNKVRQLRSEIQLKVDAIVEAAVAAGTVDAVPSISQAVPIKVVGDLVGVPEEGRDLLIKGADAVFSRFAPLTPSVEERLPHAGAYLAWIRDIALRGDLLENSWGRALFEAHGRGDLGFDELVASMSGFLVAGLDTTVNSISSMLHIFAQQPEVWTALQQDRSRIPAMFEETLRFEPPVAGFFRRTARNVEIEGSQIQEGSRVFLCYASGNRDDRHYDDPDTFDLTRNPVDHLAMGHGIHTCVGGALARMEAAALLNAMLDRVDSVHAAGEPVRWYNPLVRGFESLPITLIAK